MGDDSSTTETQTLETEETDGGLPEGYDPADYKAPEVVEEVSDADSQEKARVGHAELDGKERKTVLAAAGVDPNDRFDASGRRLLPWEIVPAKVAD